jgi:hypothetical protein
MNTPTYLKPSHSSHLLAYEDATDSVPKRRHIKFRCRGITQKKAYNTFVHVGDSVQVYVTVHLYQTA